MNHHGDGTDQPRVNVRRASGVGLAALLGAALAVALGMPVNAVMASLIGIWLVAVVILWRPS